MAYDWTSNSIADFGSSGRARETTIIRPPLLSRWSLLKDLQQLVHYRDLLYTLTVHRIKVRYKQSLLGVTWAILQPVSMMLILTAVFSKITRLPSDGAPYPIFTYVALLPWNAFASSVSTATGGLVNHSQLVTRIYFPREILPITYVLAALFDFLVASSVLVALMFYYKVPVTSTLLYTLPIMVVLVSFSLAISLLSSATQVHFRDIGMAMPLLLQIWMFATPIIYPLSAVPQRLQFAYMFNPMVGVIEGFRKVVLYSQAPDFGALGGSALIVWCLLIGSYLYFKRVEATMADVI
jgi:homopolymeric O-antigen transport system permease protein